MKLSLQENGLETFGNWDENGESVREKAKGKDMHKKKIKNSTSFFFLGKTQTEKRKTEAFSPYANSSKVRNVCLFYCFG